MNKSNGYWACTLIFVLAISLASPSAVRADTPAATATDVPAATPTPQNTSQPTDQATAVPTYQPTATDSLSATDTPVPTETPTPANVVPDSTGTPGPSGVLDALGQAPAGTQVVALDQNGNALPLATKAAAVVVQTGDPIWCPQGSTPGDAGCTSIGVYANLADLVTFLSTSQPTQNGTIWIKANSDSSPTGVTIDGSALTTWRDFSLTLQGGWSGAADSNVNPLDPSLFSVPLTIVNWQADVAVNNVSISGASNSGLTVSTTGNASLNSVSVTGTGGGNGISVSTGGQADLNQVDASNNALSGAQVQATGDANITDSNFNHNGYGALATSTPGPGPNETTTTLIIPPGVKVSSGHDVKLTGVTADANQGTGAQLYSVNATTVSDSQFNDNGSLASLLLTTGSDANHSLNLLDLHAGNGLDASAAGQLKLDTVVASGNDGIGANLSDGSLISVMDSTFTSNGSSYHTYVNNLSNFTPTMFGTFTQFSDLQTTTEGPGLQASTNGDVNLSNDQVNSNFGNGASLGSLAGNISVDTSNFNGNGLFRSSSITDSGTSFFLGTFDTLTTDTFGGTGLEADSETGSVSLTNVNANGNGDAGADLTGNSVSVDPSTFAGNGFIGSTHKVEHSGNSYSTSSGAGLIVNGVASISLEGLLVSGNAGDGAALGTEGIVGVSDSSFTGNGFQGDTSQTTFQNNQVGASGLTALGTGTISLMNVLAAGNAKDGMNFQFSGGGSLSVYDSSFTANGFSAGTDTGGFGSSTNVGSGLEASGDPTSVSLAGVIAGSNAGFGSLIEINASQVSVTSSQFNDNGQKADTMNFGSFSETLFGDGLAVPSNSASLSLEGVQANGNGGYGAELFTISSDNLTINSSVFNQNGSETQLLSDFSGTTVFNGSGLNVLSGGNIILQDVTASNNGADGAELASDGANVSVSGGAYRCNDAYGILIDNGTGSVDFSLTDLGGDGSGPFQLNGAIPDMIQFTANGCFNSPQVISLGPNLPTTIIPVTGTQSVPLNCQAFAEITLNEADRDQATFVCPVSGLASFDEALQDGLPMPLPSGETFISAHTAGLTTSTGSPIQVITDGGNILLSLVVPVELRKSTLAILYWDPTLKNGAGDWYELPVYATDAHGFPVITQVHPDQPSDLMRVLKGVRLFPDGTLRTTVNFTGTFVLVTK